MMNGLFISIIMIWKFPHQHVNALFQFKDWEAVWIHSVCCETWEKPNLTLWKLLSVCGALCCCQGLLLSLIDMVIDVLMFGFKPSVWLLCLQKVFTPLNLLRFWSLAPSDFKTHFKTQYFYLCSNHTINVSCSICRVIHTPWRLFHNSHFLFKTLFLQYLWSFVLIDCLSPNCSSLTEVDIHSFGSIDLFFIAIFLPYQSFFCYHLFYLPDKCH